MRWLVLLSISASIPMLAPEAAWAEDRWLGPDKALHFGVSAALAAGGYALSVPLTDTEPPRLIVGASLALGAGIAKELYDWSGRGDASFRDLAWDVLGTVTGLLIAWGLDRLLDRSEPAMGGP